MLTLYHNGAQYPIQDTEYYIRELASGLDEVIFDISIYDPIYAILAEEENITDRGGQRYLVKQIDAGADLAKVVCQLDLDEWKATLSVDYNSGSKTVAQTIDAIKPTGWTVNDRSGSSISRTIKGNYTPLEICIECTSVFSVYIRWDNKTKTCTIYPKAMGAPVGAFATRELNLKEINYKGKSNDLITRLYAYGKDGLSFASINDNKPYVDNNTYDSRIICGYWQDERYTVAADLLRDAQEKLATLAVPDRSYDCSIVDLQATNPELYNNLDFSLFTAATLIDDIKNTAVDYQVIERHIYPYHPEDNAVIFNSAPLKITNAVISVEDSIENPNSTFQQIQNQRIAEATNWLLSGDGYVVAVKGSNDEWKELLFMDTPDMATAQKVLRINENGIGFSTTGVNGPYTNAWTIDGQLNASFITTGTLTANLIKAGIISDLAGKFSLDMETGTINMQDGTFSGNMNAKSGYIGNGVNGFKIGNTAISNGPESISDTSTVGACYAINGLIINAAGKHSMILGNEIFTNGTFKCKAFTIGDNGVLGKINGRFNNINGYTIQTTPDSTQFALLHLAGSDSTGRYVLWDSSSDRRLKENIKPVSIDFVRLLFKGMEPVSFNYINDKEKRTEYGLIAQDLEEVFKDAGDPNNAIIGELEGEEKYKYITYQKMVGLIIPAIQDLYKTVEKQAKQIEALQVEVERLKHG